MRISRVHELSVLSEADFARLIARAATELSHLVPFFRAARYGGIGFIIQPPIRRTFWPVRDKRVATVVVLQDPAGGGPKAFHAASLRRLFHDVARAVIVAAAPSDALYAATACKAAEDQCDMVIIETPPDAVLSWYGAMDAEGILDRRPAIIHAPEDFLEAHDIPIFGFLAGEQAIVH